MAAVKYDCTFYSENYNPTTGAGTWWKIYIYSEAHTGSSTEFKCTPEGFVLDMDGGDDSLLAPIKTTSVSFNFVVEEGNSAQEQIIEDLNSNTLGNENDLSLAILQEDTGSGANYWRGPIITDLCTVDDTSPIRILSITATDGLGRLKYKPYDHITKGGNRSALYVIKECLKETYISSSYSPTAIIHYPFYYNKAMFAGSTWGSTWRRNVNHDPLALTKINTELFIDSNGESWSYYKVLEQVLACFQLRVFQSPFRRPYSYGSIAVLNTWIIQCPMVFHNNSNDSDYDSTQLLFEHTLSSSSDVANNYYYYEANDTVNGGAYCNQINDPSTRTGDSKQNFIPPLLSYKSIYNHNVFANKILGPYSWDSTSHQNQSYNATITSNELNYELTGIEGVHPNGCIEYAQSQAKQRIMVTGKVHTNVIDAGGIMAGYASGEEYWTLNNYSVVDDSGEDYYLAQDTGWHFPRMGLRVQTYSEATDAGSTATPNYWWGHSMFGTLFGSVQWMGGTETDNYPDNHAGYNFGAQGMHCNGATYDGDDTSTLTTAIQFDGQIMWGQEWSNDTDGFWMKTDSGRIHRGTMHMRGLLPYIINMILLSRG